MRNKLEENQKQLNENEKRLRYWDDKLSKLVLQNVEDLTGEPVSEDAPPIKDEPKEEDVDMDAPEADEDASMEDADTTVRLDPTARVRQPQELPSYTPDELADMSKEKLKGEIAALEEKTQN
ncbi:hypothetical protein BN1708_017897, partial [Verticillium longisporum]